MKDETRKLLLEIARDKEFASAYAVAIDDVCQGRGKTRRDGAYRAAYAHAEELHKAGYDKPSDMQLPEPWNGDIENCRVLFVGINPSVSPDEKYPMPGWTDDEIADYFERRFPVYAKRGPKGGKWETMRVDGMMKLGDHRSPTWELCYNGAKVLLGRDVVPGKDYALTEIVHPKTRKADCLTLDYIRLQGQKWMGSILSAAKNLEYVWVYSVPAKTAIEQMYFSGKEQEYYKVITPEGGKIGFIFWRHPTEFHPGPSAYVSISRRLGMGETDDAKTRDAKSPNWFDDVCRRIEESKVFHCSRSKVKDVPSLRIWPKEVDGVVCTGHEMDALKLEDRNVCVKKLGDKYVIRVWTLLNRISGDDLSNLRAEIENIYPHSKCKQRQDGTSCPIDIAELDGADDITMLTEICQGIAPTLLTCNFWN